MNTKDRLTGYFLAGATGFSIGILWMIWSIPVIYVESIYEVILIGSIMVCFIFLGYYEVQDAMVQDAIRQGE